MNLYFDNAATSWPKPACVSEAIATCMRDVCGNPGRSEGSATASVLIDQTRAGLARLFGIHTPERIVFTVNATAALNLSIQGILQPGDRVVTTSMEHNAVCRPLHALQGQGGLDLEIVRSSPEGYVDGDGLRRALAKPTRLLICNHASNVTGAINQLAPLGRLAKERGAILLVDASQSAGVVEIDVERDHVDILAAPGHKNLLGPTGTGFCYIGPDVPMRPVVFGGTGDLSDRESMPEQLPERFEPGTLNFHGIAGLSASLAYVQEHISSIQRREAEIVRRTLDGLRTIAGLTVHGPLSAHDRLPVFSISCAGRTPVELGRLLNRELGIVSRSGLHCAPWAHQTIGTFPAGTVRLSPGLFHSNEEIDFLLGVLARASRGRPPE